MRRSEIVDEHRGVAEATLRRDADEAIRLLAQNMQVTTGFYAAVLREASAIDR
jgi:DNA-binding GntR family transcriptional regulator